MVFRALTLIVLAFLSIVATMFASSFDDLVSPVIGLFTHGENFEGWPVIDMLFRFLSLAVAVLIQLVYALKLKSIAKLKLANSNFAWYPLLGTISVWLLDTVYHFVHFVPVGIVRSLALIATVLMVMVALIENFLKPKSAS
jgi:hypothetical protein